MSANAAAEPRLEDLLHWLRETTGAEPEQAERLPTVRPMWRLVLRDANGVKPVFLRCERPGEFGHARFYPVSREAAVLAALSQSGLPVPRVLARREAPSALLMSAMPGSGDFAALAAEPGRKARVVADFMRLLAAQHALDVRALGLDAVLPMPGEVTSHARLELDTWERIWREATRRGAALLDVAAGWLRARIPASPETVLVHGDTGPNQCHYAGDAICALLDWELAHLG
ncbi:MAG: phosphotransferase family protein, partial [Gammaproteobacteria bacterium]